TINLPREREPNAGIAVTADGRHLLVATGRHPDAQGYLTIYNVDPTREPTKGNLAPGNWGKQEFDVALGGIPLSLTASPDPTQPGFAAITFRYPVMAYSMWETSHSLPNKFEQIATVTLGAGGPVLDRVFTKVQGGNLDDYAHPSYNGYYTNILTP